MNDGIFYGGKWYDRSKIKQLSTIRGKSMISEECSINTLTVEIYSDEIGADSLLTVFAEDYAPYGFDSYVVEVGDIRRYTPFAPVEIWDKGVMMGRYYLTNVERTGRNWFILSACSPIGILDQIEHKGGMYAQQTFAEICAEIIGSAITYDIALEIASLPITGWLPYSNARSNLNQLLFAVGAAATYDENGDLIFKYNEPDVSVDIPDGNLYMGGSVGYTDKASKVSLIEHAWFLDETVDAKVLFDNTSGVSVNNSLVVFDGPYHSLMGEGLTITPVNCNCCYVSGTGSLTGKPYYHTQRELVEQDPEIRANERRVANATLISSLNSLNALRRLYNYLHNADEVTYDIVSDGSFKCGDLISFTDPFGDEMTGYVKEMTEAFSGIIKSSTKIAINWQPKYLGNTYQHSMIITAEDLVDGVWTVPETLRGNPAQVVLFSGFGGGSGGYDGEDGEDKWFDFPFSGYSSYLPRAGQGGAPGEAGAYPHYIIGEYESLGSSYAASFGAGGEGGAVNGGAGGEGGHSTFGAFDTDRGEMLTGRYVNLLDGSVVASKGSVGFAGGDGGSTRPYSQKGSVIKTEISANGKNRYMRYSDVGANGGAVGGYSGGLGCHGGSIEWNYQDDDAHFYEGPGSGGGGAAYGANGGDADEYWMGGALAPKAGGDGANALAPADAALGFSGAGGNGGGGGGAGGIAFGYVRGAYNDVGNHSGAGGNGSRGGKGSPGFALIYY